ncbi:MAG: cytidylate kinase-like family protein [Prevotella sp.]|jgi:cytidylate kinase|nr:cytidylate kinase-like family protein [Prevotella sp.]MBO7538138.1 cytidylate kinase-like family protein [Prevotella sp.]
MNKNENFIITINRELGSGGRTVGRLLAEKLGVAFYDKWLINELKSKFNISTEEVEKVKGGNSSWWREMLNSAIYMGEKMSEINSVPHPPMDAYHLVTTDDMYKVETEIFSHLADNESCIVAGRTGFYVFRNHPNHLSILIQASMPFRIERVMRKQDMSEDEARMTIEKVDKMRENYVKKFTKTSRYDTRNYDLVISADNKTEEEIVDLIMNYIG